MANDRTLETRLAETVIGPLEREQWCEDERTIRIRLRKAPGWKLSLIIFSKRALRRLGNDPDREVKVEYLRRDIARQAKLRSEYRYPRQFVLEVA